jgi:tRNA dimethylallyltransferase
MQKTIYIIAGPTAGGKSAKALEIASKTNGIIINCDSMQVYDGLRILTAQPGPQDRQATEHMLYGTLHPNDTCSAGLWREMVVPLITNALAQGRTPIIVGGSGLYIKALIDGLSPMPTVPAEIRQAATRKQQELGNPAFHAALAERDPVMAARFHPSHTARLVRAWEVLEATGKSLSEWQKEARTSAPDDWHFEIIKIMPERDVLYHRCNDRFLWMLENGVLEEVKSFAGQIESEAVRADVPLVKSLGFRPIRDYIKGLISKEEAIEKAQTETRQYARRQVTWFRNQL